MKPQQGLNKWNQAKASLKMQPISQTDVPPTSVESEKYNHEPASNAATALEQLFCQAQGLRSWPTRTYSPVPAAPTYKPVAGGDPVAIQTYARLICEHVKNLNSLIGTHKKHLLPVSQMRVTWPILKSKHPHFSEDEKTILNALDVGSTTDRHLATYCRYKPAGKIARLVDELVWWIDVLKLHPFQKVLVLQNLYTCDEEPYFHPI